MTTMKKKKQQKGKAILAPEEFSFLVAMAQAQSHRWYRFAMQKFPLLRALAPLLNEHDQQGTDVPQPLCDALIEEHNTLNGLDALQQQLLMMFEEQQQGKAKPPSLSRADRERGEAAQDKATAAIRQQYRKVSVRIHPDRHGDQFAIEMEALQQAFAILSDPEQRRQYMQGFWGVCQLIHEKRRRGEKISYETETQFVLDRHQDWMKLYENNKDEEKLPAHLQRQGKKNSVPQSNCVNKMQKRHLQQQQSLLQDEQLKQLHQKQRPLAIQAGGGWAAHTPRQIGVRSVHAKNRTAQLSLPVPQPVHDFYAAVEEVRVVLLDGTQEILLRTVRGEALRQNHAATNGDPPEELLVTVTLPDRGTFHVAWYATFPSANGAEQEFHQTPRSSECQIVCVLEQTLQVEQNKPLLLREARQAAGTLRILLSDLSLSSSTAARCTTVDELERRYWNLHRVVAKTRHTEQRLRRIHDVLDETPSDQVLTLAELIDAAAKPKAALEQALAEKRVKSDSKFFKRFVAAKIESGKAATWMRYVTEDQLVEVHGSSNRLYQFLVDGNRAEALGVTGEALEAAAQRDDFFTPKQCDKLLRVRDEVASVAAAEAQAIRQQLLEEEEERLLAEQQQRQRREEEEQKRLQAELLRQQQKEEEEEQRLKAELQRQLQDAEEQRLRAERRGEELPLGSAVCFVGIQSQPTLNGAKGTFIGLTESGRFKVQLSGAQQNCRTVSVARHNLCLDHEYEEIIVEEYKESDSSSDLPLNERMNAPTVSSESSSLRSTDGKSPPNATPMAQPTGTTATSASSLDESTEAHRTLQVPNEKISQLYGNGLNLKHLKTIIGLSKVIVAQKAQSGMRSVQLVGCEASVEVAEKYCWKVLNCSSPTPSLSASVTSTQDSTSASTSVVSPQFAELHTKQAPVPSSTSQAHGTGGEQQVKFIRRELSHAILSPRLRVQGFVNTRPVNQHTIELAPNRKLDKFIGAQGKGLKQIIAATGLDMIVVYKETGKDGMKIIQMTGPADRLHVALNLCPSNGSHKRTQHKENRYAYVSHLVRPDGDWVKSCTNPTREISLLIPSNAAGFLIGKNGRTLRQIADTCTGVEVINVIKNSYEGMQKVQIQGNETGVKQAEIECARILSTLSKRPEFSSPLCSPPPLAHQSKMIFETIYIPYEVCGEVIGKRGDHLQEMKRLSGVAHIVVLPESNDGFREMRIKGPAAGVAKVVAMVQEFIAAKAGLDFSDSSDK